MHDPKFEKEVQQKMEELEFSPSELVWANLQRGLHKEKRRRTPLLWLFFLLGGMMLGAGGASLFYFNRHSPLSRLSGTGSPATTRTVDAIKTADAGKRVDPTRTNGTNKTNGANKIIDANKTDNVTISPAPAKTATSREGAATPAGMMTATKGQLGMMTAAKGPVTMKGSVKMKRPATIGGSMTGSSRLPVSVDQPDRRRSGGIVTPMPALLHPDADWDIAAHLSRIPLGSATTILNAPNLNTPVNRSPVQPAVTMNKMRAKKARFSNTPTWEAGFAGGGGLSSAVLSPSSSVTVTGPAPSNVSLAASLRSSSNAAGSLQLRFSRIRPDLSFWAGIFVQRPVLKKLSLSIGLNLHYYSTRLETGQKAADSVNTAASSYFRPNPYAQLANQYAPYYAPNNYKYFNHYYFLEIPISLQWQFNHSRKAPLFWEGGLSFSRLVSANALYYNEKSGVYYKDGGGANPNHLMAFSSVMIGLSWRGNLIKLGPEAQYGLSSLVNPNDASCQHLFYGGIKISVSPRKW